MSLVEQQAVTGQAEGAAPGKAFGNGAIAAGVAIITLFVSGLACWLLLAPIESAVVAPGVVSVDSNRKTIQHLEGGIVAAIAVREGDKVRAGGLLIRLEDTEKKAQRNQLRAQHADALARLARLQAERDGADDIGFPQSLLDRADDPAVEEALNGQSRIFASRRRLQMEQGSVLTRRMEGYRDEIGGLEGQIAAADRQLALIAEELDMLRLMDARKLVGKPQLLALQRKKAEIEGLISEQRAAVARANRGILESQLRIAELAAMRTKEIDEELRLVQARVYELRQQLTAAEDVLRRTRILSPIDGTVIGLQLHTIGGVVVAGEPLLDVVPSDEELVVQATVDPRDIEQVRTGLAAHVELLAYNRRVRQPIDGVVSSLSADALSDPLTGAPYYRARVRLVAESLQAQPVALQPGMTAEVMIRTGARTPLEYLMEPVSRNFRRAMREE